MISLLFTAAAFQLAAARLPDSTARRIWILAHLDRVPVSGAGVRSVTRQLEAARAMGFRGAKLEIPWSQVEPAPHRFDWSHPDSVVREMRRQGVRAYGLLAYSPGWARPAGIGDHHRPVVHGSAAAGDTAFARYAAAAARRYRTYIKAWEIWNEPNHPAFWIDERDGENRGPSAADYLELYRLARDSIRAVDPSAVVISGGLASFSGHRARIPDPTNAGQTLVGVPASEFLEQLLDLGMRADAVGLHPYSDLPPGDRSWRELRPAFPDVVIGNVVRVLHAHPGRTTPRIWVTEWGVRVPSAGTAERMRRWYRDALIDMLCTPEIASITVYCLYDDRDHDFALLSESGAPSVLGEAYQRALIGWRGCGR